MLIFNCPQCDNRFELPDGMAGKKGKCPGCGTRFQVPFPGKDPVLLSPPTNDDLLPDEPPKRAPRPEPVPVMPLNPRPPRASATPPRGTPSRPAPEAYNQYPEPVIPEPESAPAPGLNKASLFIGIGGAVALVLAVGVWIGSGKRGDDEDRLPGKTTAAASNTASTTAPVPVADTRPKLSASDIIERFGPAVVRVEIYGEAGKFLGHGSGFVVDPGGIVVTNFHVIDGALTIKIKCKDGNSYDLEGVLAFDPKLDFAVIKAAGVTNWPTIKLGDSDHVPAGSHVVTIGHSLGFDYTISEGLCSGRADPGAAFGDPMGHQMLQINAPISPGNSGGPLFDEYGEVIGVNTLTIIASHAQALNFSLPINDVKPHLTDTTVRPLTEVVAEGRKRSVGDLVKDGARLLQQHDRVRAFMVFKTAYEREPKNLEVVTGYAEALNMVGQNHLAREKCEEALVLQPGAARALRALGDSYYQTNDAERAMIAFRRSLQKDSTDAKARILLANILSQRKRGPEAVALVDAALLKPTEDLDLLVHALLAYARAGDAGKAEEVLKRFPKDAEHENDVRAGKGFIALESGHAAEAVEYLARAVETAPNDPFLRLNLARAFELDNKWEKAIAEYQACLELEETLYPALKGLARLYDQRSLTMEALGLYRACVQFSPTDLEANLRLAQILGDIGHAEEAIPFLKTALEHSPGYRPCVLALAEALSEAGERDKASDMLAPLANGSPPDMTARLALAEIYLQQGRAKDATALLLQTRVGGTQLARKLVLYGKALEAVENFVGAGAAYDEAVSLDPERGTYRYLRAIAYVKQDRRMGRAALVAYLEWAANRKEEQERLPAAQELLSQMR